MAKSIKKEIKVDTNKSATKSPKSTFKTVTAKVKTNKVETPDAKLIKKVVAKKETANSPKKKIVSKAVAPASQTNVRKKIVELPPKIERKIKKIEPQILMAMNDELTQKPSNKKVKDNGKFVAPDKVKSKSKSIRYSDADLKTFKEVIEVAKMEALEELQMLKERVEDFNNFDFAEESMTYSLHMAEQGSEAIEKEKAYAQIQRTSEYIQKLNDALTRVEDKTYGICRICKCLIAKERLLAVPITTLSASYKLHSKCPGDGIDRIEKI